MYLMVLPLSCVRMDGTFSRRITGVLLIEAAWSRSSRTSDLGSEKAFCCPSWLNGWQGNPAQRIVDAWSVDQVIGWVMSLIVAGLCSYCVPLSDRSVVWA